MRKMKKLEVKNFLLMQMGEVPGDSGNGSVTTAAKKKRQVGNSMNVEELRINKQLL